MGAWATGDFHGKPERLDASTFLEQLEFTEENYVIVLGDFGLVWAEEESKYEKTCLNWLASKPFTVLFVDGNHENHARLATLPEKEWHGGKVHVVRPNVLHLKRGEVFEIEGKTFFTFGGARSQDIHDGILDANDPEWRVKAQKMYNEGRWAYRVKGLSWWEEEMPSDEEMEYGLANLARVNNKVDFVITHSPSTFELGMMDGFRGCKPDALTNYLDKILYSTDYGQHLFGHMHVNQCVGSKAMCLYTDIKRII